MCVPLQRFNRAYKIGLTLLVSKIQLFNTPHTRPFLDRAQHTYGGVTDEFVGKREKRDLSSSLPRHTFILWRIHSLPPPLQIQATSPTPAGARFASGILRSFALGEDKFYCADGAPEDIAQKRRDGMNALADSFNKQFAASQKASETVLDGISGGAVQVELSSQPTA